MTTDIVHFWAVRVRERIPGPDPDEPERDSYDFEDVALYHEEARAKEVMFKCKADPNVWYVGLTEVSVPSGHVCWVYEAYFSDRDRSGRVCSDIHVSSSEEWAEILMRHIDTLAKGGRPSSSPMALTPVW